jgi:hypothetical protein
MKNYKKLSNTILMSQFSMSGSYYVVLSLEFKIHMKMKIFSQQTITNRTENLSLNLDLDKDNFPYFGVYFGNVYIVIILAYNKTVRTTDISWRGYPRNALTF